MPLSSRSPWAFSPAGQATFATNPFTGTELSSKLGNLEQREKIPWCAGGNIFFWGGGVVAGVRPWRRAETHQGLLSLGCLREQIASSRR